MDTTVGSCRHVWQVVGFSTVFIQSFCSQNFVSFPRKSVRTQSKNSTSAAISRAPGLKRSQGMAVSRASTYQGENFAYFLASCGARQLSGGWAPDRGVSPNPPGAVLRSVGRHAAFFGGCLVQHPKVRANAVVTHRSPKGNSQDRTFINGGFRWKLGA